MRRAKQTTQCMQATAQPYISGERARRGRPASLISEHEVEYIVYLLAFSSLIGVFLQSAPVSIVMNHALLLKRLL